MLFDLDDTLYPQRAWLEGAWPRVAGAAPATVDRGRFLRALEEIAAEGTDRGGIIDRALTRVGARDVEVAPLVEAFRGHAPPVLEPYPGVAEGLKRLRRHVSLGLVTDGDPRIQRAKLSALGLTDAFDVVLYSDHFGRHERKPHAMPFMRALAALGVEPACAVYVGDRPDKDVAGAQAAGIRAVRVRTGEYRDRPNRHRPWADVADFAAALCFLLGARARR